MRISDCRGIGAVEYGTARVLTPEGLKHTENVPLIREHRLEVFVGREPAFELSCTPEHLPELILGRLISGGAAASPEDVESIELSPDGRRADVSLAGGAAAAEPARLEPIAWTAEQVRALAQCMRRDTPLHLLTRGTHSCFLARDGELLFAGEDIGRHNALDKAIGWALMNGVDLRACMAHVSGRVPSDMAMKAVRARVPVLVSKEAPTAEGLAAARKYGLTLVGAGRDGSIRTYCRSYAEEAH